MSVKDGCTQNLKLVQLAKEIWDHLIQCRSLLLQSTFHVNWIWQQIGSQETIRTPRNGSEFHNHFREFVNWGEESPRDRSIRFQIISSNQDLLFVEARSIEPSSRSFPTKFVPQESLCFSPILHDPKGFVQSPQRQSTYDHSCNYSLAITNLVPRSNENFHTATNFIGLEEKFLKNPNG